MRRRRQVVVVLVDLRGASTTVSQSRPRRPSGRSSRVGSARASSMSRGKSRSPESKKSSGLNRSAIAASSSPPSRSSAAPPAAHGPSIPPRARRAARSRAGARRRPRPARTPGSAALLALALQQPVHEPERRPRRAPARRAGRAAGPGDVRDRDADEHEDRGREGSEERPAYGSLGRSGWARRRMIQNTPVVTRMAKARSPQSPAPRRSQLRKTSTTSASRNRPIARLHRAATPQPSASL